VIDNNRQTEYPSWTTRIRVISDEDVKNFPKASKEVIEDQTQLFRNVYPELADKVEEALANTEPPKPQPKPATV